MKFYLIYNMSSHYICELCNERVNSIFRLFTDEVCLDCAKEAGWVTYENDTPLVEIDGETHD